MATTRDYYEILGVSRSASSEDIRRAHRKLARQYHPDVNKGADASKRFAEIQEAYDVLSDPEKRKAYDQFGHAGVGVGGGGPRGPGGPGGPGGAGGAGAGTAGQWRRDPSGGWSYSVGGSPGGFDANHFGSIFDELFGGGAARTGESPFGRSAPGRGAAGAGSGYRSRPPQRGRDIQRDLTVSFNTAIKGGTEHVCVHTHSGDVQTIEVKVPAGINTGEKLRIRGKGEPPPDGEAAGKPGDLILNVQVGRHPWYRRDGLDVLLDVPITIAEAALGTTVSVPLPQGGTVEIKIPPGTSSGRKIRIPGRGIEQSKTKRGDFYAVMQIAAPSALSDRATSLLESLREELKNPREMGPWAD